MKKPRKLRVDTEAAARRAEKFLANLNPMMRKDCVRVVAGEKDFYIVVYDLEDEIICRVPFSWLYKKRAPLTGVTKRLTKAIRKPKAKK